MVSGEELWIRTASDMGRGRFSVFRSDGALMHEGPLLGNTTTVSIAHFASGVYVVHVIGKDDRINTAKLVIAR